MKRVFTKNRPFKTVLQFVISIISLQQIKATPYWDLTDYTDLEAQPSYAHAFPQTPPNQYYASHARSGSDSGSYISHHHPPYPYPQFGYHHHPQPALPPPAPYWNPYYTDSWHSRGFFKPSVPFFPHTPPIKTHVLHKDKDWEMMRKYITTSRPRMAQSAGDVDCVDTPEIMPASATDSSVTENAADAASSSTEPALFSSTTTQDPIFDIDLRFKAN